MEQMSSESGDKQQPRQSPVEVIASIRKDLAEFQRNSSREALREFMREACKEDLIHAFHHNLEAPSAVIEHLVDRGLIRLNSRRSKKTNGNGTAAGRFDRYSQS
jgi:hypothetical protein